MKNKKLVMKLHQIGDETIVAAADFGALGKKYSGNGRHLDLQLFRSFYEGKEASGQELCDALLSCSSANLVGKEAVSAAISNGLAKTKDIVDIGGIMHLQIFRMPANEQ